MSDFWGFEYAHLWAIGLIIVLAGICLYLARSWGAKL